MAGRPDGGLQRGDKVLCALLPGLDLLWVALGPVPGAHPPGQQSLADRTGCQSNGSLPEHHLCGGL